jgi:hypothetical protein
MGSFFEKHVKRFQKSLNEPGLINDALTLVEQYTGVDRIYIAPGKFQKNINNEMRCFVDCLLILFFFFLNS